MRRTPVCPLSPGPRPWRHIEGELLVAADDRLAALLEWPELAHELTCRSGSHDR